MLKARCNDGTMILGLDAENIRRLQAKKPILLDLAEVGGVGKIMIVAGATLQEIADDLGVGTMMRDIGTETVH